MRRLTNKGANKPLIALLTNHCDDIVCFRKEVIQSLVDRGYDVLISCPSGVKLAQIDGIPHLFDDVKIDRRGVNAFADGRLFIHYYHLFNRYRPSIVSCYTVKPNIYGSIAAALLGIPYVNNVTGYGSAFARSKTIAQVVLFLFRIAFKRSNCVFFQNETNQAFSLSSGMVKGNHRLLPGSGVNTERFSLLPYPSDEEGIVFLYIGRIMKEKGIDDFIETARRITARYSYVFFHIIGFVEPTESHYVNDLERLQQMHVLTYYGDQTDVRPFIARAHATIHPSVYGEGMSNVLLESASSGRPVITTDATGCRETVDDGFSGFIFPRGDTEQLIKTVEKFIRLTNTQRAEMGVKGREKMLREFDRNVVIRAYQEEIDAIIRSRREV